MHNYSCYPIPIHSSYYHTLSSSPTNYTTTYYSPPRKNQGKSYSICFPNIIIILQCIIWKSKSITIGEKISAKMYLFSFFLSKCSHYVLNSYKHFSHPRPKHNNKTHLHHTHQQRNAMQMMMMALKCLQYFRILTQTKSIFLTKLISFFLSSLHPFLVWKTLCIDSDDDDTYFTKLLFCLVFNNIAHYFSHFYITKMSRNVVEKSWVQSGGPLFAVSWISCYGLLCHLILIKSPYILPIYLLWEYNIVL